MPPSRTSTLAVEAGLAATSPPSTAMSWKFWVGCSPLKGPYLSFAIYMLTSSQLRSFDENEEELTKSQHRKKLVSFYRQLAPRASGQALTNQIWVSSQDGRRCTFPDNEKYKTSLEKLWQAFRYELSSPTLQVCAVGVDTDEYDIPTAIHIRYGSRFPARATKPALSCSQSCLCSPKIVGHRETMRKACWTQCCMNHGSRSNPGAHRYPVMEAVPALQCAHPAVG